MTTPRSASMLPALVLGLLLLPGLYLGGYAALVQRAEFSFWCGFGANTSYYAAHYRVGGDWADKLFAPAHALDRRVRAAYWEPQWHTPLSLPISLVDEADAWPGLDLDAIMTEEPPP
jgi:hypothetical protein